MVECDKDSDFFGELLTDKGRFSMIGTYPVVLLGREMVIFLFIFFSYKLIIRINCRQQYVENLVFKIVKVVYRIIELLFRKL